METEIKSVQAIYISNLEYMRLIDRNCKFCQEKFYPELEAGKRMEDIHAPRHMPSHRCESGKRPHCTCDTCF